LIEAKLKILSKKVYPDSWEIYLKDKKYEEIEKINLSSKHCIWLHKENANWGNHKIINFEKTEILALVNEENKIVAVNIGNGKLSKLCVNSQYHWEQRGTIKLGPGLDWKNKKNWDFRFPEKDIWDIILTGKIPSSRKVMIVDEENLD
jgi:hypothetical protein